MGGLRQLQSLGSSLLVATLVSCGGSSEPSSESEQPNDDGELESSDKAQEESTSDIEGDIIFREVPRDSLRDPSDCERLRWDFDDDKPELEISWPRVTLEEGFEFVDVAGGTALARREHEWRVFRVVECDAEEVRLPDSVQGKDLRLSKASLLACDEVDCRELIYGSELSDPEEDCSLQALVYGDFRGAPELLGRSVLGDESCTWTQTQVACGGAERVDLPTEEKVDFITPPLCIHTETNTFCETAGQWQASPPLYTRTAEAQCGGVEAMNAGLGSTVEVTLEGVIWFATSESECTQASDALGPFVAMSEVTCACVTNPVVVTATQLFSTCACINCR